MQERFEASDPEMLKNVSLSATAAVAKIISAWHGKDAAQQVSAEEIVQIFCKHALNSMTVVTPDLSRHAFPQAKASKLPSQFPAQMRRRPDLGPLGAARKLAWRCIQCTAR